MREVGNVAEGIWRGGTRGASGSCAAVLFLNRLIRRYACGLRMCLPKCYLRFFWGVRGNKKKERDIRSSSGSIQRSFPSSRIMYWSKRYQQQWVKPNKDMWTSQQLAMWLLREMSSRPHVVKMCPVRWGGLFKYQLSLDQTLASLENCMLRKKHQNCCTVQRFSKGQTKFTRKRCTLHF